MFENQVEERIPAGVDPLSWPHHLSFEISQIANLHRRQAIDNVLNNIVVEK